MNRRLIQRATRDRIREVLEQELVDRNNFSRLVTRKSIDLRGLSGSRTVMVHGFSPPEEWDEVEKEVKKFWRKLGLSTRQ